MRLKFVPKYDMIFLLSNGIFRLKQADNVCIFARISTKNTGKRGRKDYCTILIFCRLKA